MRTPIRLLFRRLFVRGHLEGLTHYDSIRHVDRWHAAHWLRGIRRNTRKGVLDYKITFARAERGIDDATGLDLQATARAFPKGGAK